MKIDFEAMIADVKEMVKDLVNHGGEHSQLAAKRLEGALISLEKQLSLEPKHEE